MKRWSVLLCLVLWSVGFLLGCVQDTAYKDVCGPDGCDPQEGPTPQIEEKHCPIETHSCVPRVGGGWDPVVRWEGLLGTQPDRCPELAAGMSFWGHVLLPVNSGIPYPQYAIGCGFAEPAACENDLEQICAPAIPDWPACIVANSHRECPPDYRARTIVGSEDADDLAWTVCCTAEPTRPADLIVPTGPAHIAAPFAPPN